MQASSWHVVVVVTYAHAFDGGVMQEVSLQGVNELLVVHMRVVSSRRVVRRGSASR
jgi:hypothetical protein